MKKITLILITLFAFIYANAQYTVPRGLPYHDTRWIENKGVAGATYLFDSIVMFRNIADTQMKPLYPALAFILDFNGDSTFWVYDTKRWKKLAIGSNGGGTVTLFSSGNLSPLFTTSVATSTTTPALTFSLTNAAGGTVFGNNTGSSAAPAYTSVPVLGIAGTTKGTIGLAGNTSGVITIQPQAAAGTFNFNLPITAGTSGFVLTSGGGGSTAMTWTDPTATARTALSLTTTGTSGASTYNSSTGVLNIPQYNSGTVTSFSAGNLSPLFTTSVATSTTTPALTFSLTNAAGGTVFGNNTGSSAAPAYTSSPVLGIAGTTTGTLGFSGSTSGTVTVQPAAAAGTWSLTLPTTGGTSGYFLQTNGSGVTTWAAASGGTTLTRQIITSGASGTVTGGNYIVTIDPASTLAAYTLTMPASPSDLDIVEVDFGGTLTSGTIVTALTISANSGQTILDNTPPVNSTADNTLFYRYRTANTTWYRFKP